MAKEFLGIGWKFPAIVEDSTGKIAMSAYEEDIQESIRIILFTSKGERVMQPDFGCGIHEFVFASINTMTLGLVETNVLESLSRWEPRIKNITVQVTPDSRMGRKTSYRYQVFGSFNQ